MQYQSQIPHSANPSTSDNFNQKNNGSFSSLKEEIHQRAIHASQQLLNAESNLIEILQQVEQHRIFIEYGHSSLFHYITKELKISESIAYNLMTVSRKAREVPALKMAIEKKEITLSNARKLTPILNQENQARWLSKAQTLSSRQLEKEIARENPKLAIPEKVTYATSERIQLTVGLLEKDMLQLRRVQDLLCKMRQSNVTLEDTLIAMTEDFLNRKDPVKKAKRIISKKGITPTLKPVELVTTKASVAAVATVATKASLATNTAVAAKASVATIALNQAASTNLTESIKTPVTRQEQDVSHFQKHSLNESTEQPLRHFDHLSTRSSLAFFSTRPKPFKTRTAIPAPIAHQVWLRDEGRCTHLNQDGVRCRNSRYIEIHHIKPVATGGENTIHNLTTLCTTHHRHLHARS